MTVILNTNNGVKGLREAVRSIVCSFFGKVSKCVMLLITYDSRYCADSGENGTVCLNKLNEFNS